MLDAHHIQIFRFLGVSDLGCAQLAAAHRVFIVAVGARDGVVFRWGETEFGGLAATVGRQGEVE